VSAKVPLRKHTAAAAPALAKVNRSAKSAGTPASGASDGSGSGLTATTSGNTESTDAGGDTQTSTAIAHVEDSSSSVAGATLSSIVVEQISTAPEPAVDAVAATQATTVTSVSTLLAAVLSSSVGSDPLEPVESPAVWVLAAAARRQLGEQSAEQEAVNGQAAMGLVVAAAATTNQPPVIGRPVLGAADPITGTVTGTPGVTDPEGKRLTYKLISEPALGTLTFNATTGAFTYTPTATQRILAGLPGGTLNAVFTVSVSDGVNTVFPDIEVPISPTAITDAGTINTGTNTFGLLVTNSRAYVTNDDNTITVIDTINRTVLGDITFDDEPLDVAVAPDGKKLYITTLGSDSVTVINTATNTITSHIGLTGRYPSLIAVSPDGKTLYTTTTDERTGGEIPTITKISTATGKVTGTVQLPGAIASFYALAPTPDGKKVYVITDLATEDPDDVPPSGLYTFASTAKSAQLIDDGVYFIGLQISPDGSRVYVNDVDSGEIKVIDTKTNTVADTIDVPVDTLGGVTLNGDGSVLLAVDTLSNSVVAFETTTGDYDVLTAVPTTVTTVGYYPGATLSPDGTQFYYLADNGAVQVISLVPPDAKRTIGAPVLNTADPTTGAITGTVAAIPAGTKLTYTLISPPANGTLVFNKTTGAFTYTPTAAQRILAGLSSETDTVDFTVTVAVAKTTVPLTITVPVSPTQIADVGDVATGAGALGVAVTNTRAYVANTDAATVTVIDLIQRTKITDIAVDDFPGGIAVSPDGSKVYVTAQGTNTVSVIDATTNTVSSQIQLGDRSPQLMAISKDGKTLYVTTTVYDPVDDNIVISSGITKISTATNKITGTVKNVGLVPYQITVSPDGKNVYVTAEVESDTDYRTGVFVFSSSSSSAKQILGVGDRVESMDVSPDNKRLYVGDFNSGVISVIDTRTNKIIDTIQTDPETIDDLVVNPDGSLLMVLNFVTHAVDVYDTTHDYALLYSVPTNATTELYFPEAVLSPDGQELFYTSDGAMQIISLVPTN